MRNCVSIALVFASFTLLAQPDWRTPFELDSTYSAHYYEAIDYFEQLDSAYAEVQLLTYGTTDVGLPLHLAVLNTDGVFDPVKIRESGKGVLLVMNGIHPGESCGVDASMMWLRDLLQKETNRHLLDSVVVAVIPFYNVGGALERSCCYRANQNGPRQQGFRGNGRNLDLNRDGAKADSRNMRAFTTLYHQWRPHFFIDTHTSNGADYQHVMTLIGTQQDKLHPLLGDYLYDSLWPNLFHQMAAAGWPMTPYVMPVDRTPDKGLRAFLETPRYSTGYTALFNTIGFVTEAHMFKPFHQRVDATYAFLQVALTALHRDREQVVAWQQEADSAVAVQEQFALQWASDTTKWEKVFFRGFADTQVTSQVSGHLRLQYDRAQPWSDSIRWYNRYRVTDAVAAPVAYILPQAWQRAVALLQANQIDMVPLTDTMRLPVEVYYVEDVETIDFPWEGHYFHREVKVRKDTQRLLFQPGDWYVPVNQPGNRYIVEMLEPTAADSWFRWNFFDAILMQKEYFSGYVFDEVAAGLLDKDPGLRQALEEAKAVDSSLADQHYRQLDFVYKRSPYYEPSHNRYPVGRLLENVTLPLNIPAD